MEACGRLGQWRQAQAIVGQMADAYTRSVAAAEGTTRLEPALTPTAVHCNALLSAYCRGDRCVVEVWRESGFDMDNGAGGGDTGGVQ